MKCIPSKIRVKFSLNHCQSRRNKILLRFHGYRMPHVIHRYPEKQKKKLSKSRHGQVMCGETLSIVKVNSLPF